MSGMIVYPRGYTTGAPDTGPVVISSGDLVIDSLFEHSVKSKGKPKTMGYYEQILEYALLQFGSFDEWLDQQLSNPHLSGPRREFLLETVRFITEGQARNMSHYSWMFVLSPLTLKASDVRIVRHFESRKYLKAGTSTAQILQQWCGRPEGINDLLLTLYVLFGHVDRTPA